MSKGGFFKELTGLVKKHFFNKKQARKAAKAAAGKYSFSRAGAGSGKQTSKSGVSVGTVHHDSTNISDRKKQEKIEKLCEKLFEKKDMISSGKLNFLGLDKIKKRMGKSWEGIKPIVYDTVDSSIRKYMEDGDVFIRYREDIYLIIFAHASHQEAKIKSALIAEEIRRRLFETGHEELREMEIEREVRTVKTETLCGKKSLEETFDNIFSGKIDVDALKRDKPHEPLERQDEPPKAPLSTPAYEGESGLPPALSKVGTQEPQTLQTPKESSSAPRKPHIEIIEVETHRKPDPQQPTVAQYDLEQQFSFIPTWDLKRSYLSTYICVLKNDDNIDPYAAHKAVYKKLSHSQMLEYDKATLWRVITEFAEMKKNGTKNMFLCCPVHYETLVRDSSFTEYKIACQHIPQELRKFLFFIVMDCPAQAHQSTLSKFAGPLRNYCRFFCGEVPFDSKIDFVTYRIAGFHSVGINLPQMGKKYNDAIALSVRRFSAQAKKNFITFIFVLGVYDTDLISTAIFPDFDFAAGPTIHGKVQKPDGIHEFRHQDIYSKIADNNSRTQDLPKEKTQKSKHAVKTE